MWPRATGREDALVPYRPRASRLTLKGDDPGQLSLPIALPYLPLTAPPNPQPKPAKPCWLWLTQLKGNASLDTDCI